MTKNHKIIIFLLIILLLIGVVIGLNITTKEKNTPSKEETELNQTSSPKEITTEDKNITIKKPTPYYDEATKLSGITLEIISKKDYQELYLLLTINLKDTTEECLITLTNVEKNQTILHTIESKNDYMNITSWSVKQLKKEEAINTGLIQ